jgi:hypothetical protein
MAVSGQSKRKRRFHHMKAAPWKAECRSGSRLYGNAGLALERGNA